MSRAAATPVARSASAGGAVLLRTGAGQRILVGGLGDPHAAGGDVDAPGLEPAHHLAEAAPLHAADQIGRRQVQSSKSSSTVSTPL